MSFISAPGKHFLNKATELTVVKGPDLLLTSKDKIIQDNNSVIAELMLMLMAKLVRAIQINVVNNAFRVFIKVSPLTVKISIFNRFC